MPPKQQRRGGNSANRVRVSCFGPPEGEKPADAVERYSTMDAKRKQSLYEGLIAPTRIQCTGFMENLDKNRVPVPIHEKYRVKLISDKKGDVNYVPASYARLEQDDYAIWQAPTKDNVTAFWRKVWQDNTKIIICLSDTFSATDPTKCYPYWPTNEKEPVNIENGRFVIKLEKKDPIPEEKIKGTCVYVLRVTSTEADDDLVTAKKGSKTTTEEGAVETKSGAQKTGREITLHHYEGWAEGTWPNVDTLAQFLNSIGKREVQVLLKEGSADPVVIQGNAGVGRTAAIWVGAILAKDVAKKDCFDIPDLIKKFIKLRPGSFRNKLYYFVAFAAGFRQAQLTKWSESDIDKWINETEAAYKKYK